MLLKTPALRLVAHAALVGAAAFATAWVGAGTSFGKAALLAAAAAGARAAFGALTSTNPGIGKNWL